jgi:anti-anti-sigma factor
MRYASAVARTGAVQHPSRDTASFATRWVQPSIAVITAHGELDAANATQFSDYVLLHLPHTDRLVLDLGGVEFFGTEAFSAVHTVSVQAAGKGIDWMLVGSEAVRRLLRICDPDSALPICADVTEAMTRLQGPSSRLLQLVAKAR